MGNPCDSGVEDTAWSWVVCAASFVVQFLVLGVQSSFGIMFVPLLKEFNGSEMATAWSGTLSFSLMYFLGPLVTVLCHRFSCRVVTCLGALLASLGLLMTSFVTQLSLLFVTYGLLWGSGASMCYFGSMVVLNSYFRKRLSLAFGVALAGAGLGVPVTATTVSALIGQKGWRFSVRMLSIIGAVIFICGQFFKPPQTLAKEENKKDTQDCLLNGESTQRQGRSKWHCSVRRLVRAALETSRLFLDVRLLARNKALAAWTAGLCLILSGYFMPFVFLVRMTSEVGIPASQGASLIGYQAITQTVFKVIFGILGDMKPSSRIILLQVAALVNAVNTTLCPLSRGYAGFVVYVVVFGVCDGCFAVMFSMGTHLIVGSEDMPVVFGNVCSVVAIAQVLGTPLAGFIYDVYQSYSLAFFVSGGLTTVGICVLFLVPLFLPNYEHRGTDRQELIVEFENLNQGVVTEPSMQDKRLSEWYRNNRISWPFNMERYSNEQYLKLHSDTVASNKHATLLGINHIFKWDSKEKCYCHCSSGRSEIQRGDHRLSLKISRNENKQFQRRTCAVDSNNTTQKLAKAFFSNSTNDLPTIKSDMFGSRSKIKRNSWAPSLRNASTGTALLFVCSCEENRSRSCRELKSKKNLLEKCENCMEEQTYSLMLYSSVEKLGEANLLSLEETKSSAAEYVPRESSSSVKYENPLDLLSKQPNSFSFVAAYSHSSLLNEIMNEVYKSQDDPWVKQSSLVREIKSTSDCEGLGLESKGGLLDLTKVSDDFPTETYV